ncbi:MAG: hypothetical protein AAFO75_05910 [Pseudomonadota bacterium]
MTRWVHVLTAVFALTMASLTPATAADRSGYSQGEGAHPSSNYYRKGPRVKGFVARRGGYSYSKGDTINTYGDSRTKYGSTNTFRDLDIDNQTVAGPFDHGFFFDSGTSPHGGDAPYMH